MGVREIGTSLRKIKDNNFYDFKGLRGITPQSRTEERAGMYCGMFIAKYR
jgi:hypothetical protein